MANQILWARALTGGADGSVILRSEARRFRKSITNQLLGATFAIPYNIEDSTC